MWQASITIEDPAWEKVVAMKLPRFKFNPVVVFSTMMIFSVFCTFAAFYIAADNKHNLGITPTSFTISEIYRNETWSFQLDDFSFRIPEDSYIGPVYHEEQLLGIIVQSNGTSIRDNREQQLIIVEDFFLTLNSSSTYRNIKGETLFWPLENPIVQQRVIAAAKPLVQMPEVQGIAFSRTFLPPVDTVFIYLRGGETLPAANWSENIINRPFIIYFGLVVLIILLTTFLLTFDLQPDSKLKRLYAAKPALIEKGVVFFLTLPILAAGTLGILPAFMAPSVNVEAIVIYVTIALIFIILSKKDVISNQNFGLATGLRSYWRGMLVIPVILIIIVLFSVLKFPGGMNPHLAFPETALFFLFLLGYTFSAELFWRGFLQTFLERLWGNLAGLLFTVFLFTLPFFLANYLAAGLPLTPEKALEVFFFVPLTALILGYFYQRSRNLFSVALLHVLLLVIPHFLLF